MDTQRYTRKVKTCEKDLAKAKENLEKWGAPISSSIPSNVVNGTAHAPPSQEDLKLTAETSTEQPSNSNTIGAVSAESKEATTTKPKPEKGNITDAFCREPLV